MTRHRTLCYKVELHNKTMTASQNHSAPAIDHADSHGEPLLDVYAALLIELSNSSDISQFAVRKALLTRENIARVLKARADLDSEVINQLIVLDAQCRAVLKKSRITARQISEWRESVGGDTSSWWWSAEAVRRRPRSQAALNVASWLLISVALVALVQLARRVVASDALWGLVAQSYMALLVTGTIVEFARDWVTKTTAEPGHRGTISVSALAALLIVLAVAAVPQVEKLAVLKSNDAVWAKERGDFTQAIDLYEQAVRLDPGNAVTHNNLAQIAEAVGDYDLAESEFRAAIRLDRMKELHTPWFGLARLALTHHHDPTKALRFVESGRAVFAQGPFRGQVRNVDYAVGKYRGWAYLQMERFASAEKQLNSAILALPSRAAAHCLVAQALAAQKRDDAAAAECALCLDHARGENPREIEPSWIEFAERYLEEQEKP